MSEISVVVVGSTSINSVVGNGDTVNVNVGAQGGGGGGAAATIEAGTVTTIDATQTATVTNVGSAFAAKFNFSLPRGATGLTGPATSLSIGSVSTGTSAAVSITGSAPSQSLSFVLPAGPANSLSIGSVSTGTTAAVSITGAAPSQSLSFVLPQGPVGPANSLSIGSVTTGATAAVSITGSAPSQSLSFVLQPGATGPSNSLSIGSVTTGATAAVSITGSAPSQSLSFVLPQGPAGPVSSLKIGTVITGPDAAATITGTAPTQTLNLVLPQGATGIQGPQGDVGPAGPANSLSVAGVTTGTTAAVTITGAAPSQQISFVIPQGPQGPGGPFTTVQVGTVATGSAGSSAKIDTVASGGTVTLNFTIPRGADGTANLADETPQPLGVARGGSALTASRADHVHPVPVIAYGNLTGVPATFAPSTHSHAVSDVIGLQSALDLKQPAGTYVTLDGSGKISSSLLPSYVDDIVEAATFSALASITGESGKLYVTVDTRKLYRWSGSAYVEIASSPGSTDAVIEGTTNLYFTSARAAAAAPVQSVNGKTGAVTIEAGGIAWSTAPTATTAVTKAGALSYDSDYVYVANDVNQWRRAAIEDWTTPTISISVQPADQTAVAGAATFIVTASATESAELLYQWQRQAGGVGAWSNIATGLSATLSLDSLSYAANNGDKYRVVISTGSSGTGGSAVGGWFPAVAVELTPTATLTSGEATLTIAAAISIVTQPQSVSLTNGTSASFAVSATTPGTSLTYQWQSSPDGTNWTSVSGATSASFSLSAVTETGNSGRRYRCIVSSSGYPDVTSNAATLNVAPISVTTQPASQTGQPVAGTTPNYSASFSSAATSPAGAPTIQWEVSSDGANFSDLSGQTNSSLNLTGLTSSDSGKRYRAKFEKSGWSTVRSSAATLTVPADTITVTQQPSNTTAASSAYSTRTFTLPSGSWSSVSVANDKWFATPADASAGDYLATSDDGVTWASRLDVLPHAGVWSRVVHGNGVYLTVLPRSATIVSAKSTDGINWTSTTSSLASSSSVTSDLYFVESGGGWFFAYQGAGRILFSRNGNSWTSVSATTSSTVPEICVSSDGSKILLTGANFDAIYEVTNAGVGSPSGTGIFASTLTHAVHDGRRFVIVGPAASGFGSVIYAQRPDGSWDFGGVNLEISRIAFRDGRYAALTATGIASSNDGLNWVLRQSGGAAQQADTITAVDGGFMANGRSSAGVPVFYTSLDGLTWTSRGSSLPQFTTERQVVGNKAIKYAKSSSGFILNGSAAVIDFGGVLSATFSSSATTPFGVPSIQWQKSLDAGATWSTIAGATSPSLSFRPMFGDNGSRYRAVFSKSGFSTVNSASATLTASVPSSVLAITSQPSAAVASLTGEATFSITATATLGSAIFYQWQRAASGSSVYADIPTATSATLTLTGLTTPADNGSRYRCVVSATGGATTTTSNAVSLTVPAPFITISQQPSATRVAINGVASLTVVASVTKSATLSYQWERKRYGVGDFATVAGETSSTLSLTGLTADNDSDVYRVAVSATGGAAALYSSESAIVYPKLTVGRLPETTNTSSGQALLDISAAASAGVTVSYQWQKRENGASDFADIAGKTSFQLTLTGLTNQNDNGDAYRVVVSGTGGAASVTSNATALIVPLPVIAIVQQPAPQTANGGAASFSVMASASAVALLSYQWQRSAYGVSDFVTVSGATSNTLSLSGLTNALNNGDLYRVVISATGGATSVTSAAVAVLVPVPVITITSQPSSQVAVGGSATFTATAVATFTPTVSYQWQRRAAGVGSFANIPGATSSTLALTGLTNATNNGDLYQVVASASGAATSVTSGAATLTVASPVITIVSQPSSRTANVSGEATFGVSASVTGGATISYQWQKQESGAGPFVAVSGATSASLDLVGLTYANDNGDVYRVVLSSTDGAVSVTSLSAALSVPVPAITVQSNSPADASVAEGGTATLVVSSSVTGGSVLSYQWQKQESGAGAFVDVSNGGSISGATSASLSIYPASPSDNGDKFRCIVSATGGAASVTSRAASLTVISLPVIAITSQPTSQQAASNAATFAATATVTGGATLSYQWQKQESGAGPFSDVTGATSRTLPLTGLSSASDDGDWYRVVVSATGGAASVTSQAAKLSFAVVPVIVITSQPSSQSSVGGSATFSVAASVTGGATLSYQWRKRESGSVTSTDVPGATGATLALTGLSPVFDTGDAYSVIVSATGGAAAAYSNEATLTVLPTPYVEFISHPASVFASSGTARFSVLTRTVGSSSLAWQWQKQESGAGPFIDIPGSNSPDLFLSGLSAVTDNGDVYRVVISGTNGLIGATSFSATLTVPLPAITVLSDPKSVLTYSGTAALSVTATISYGSLRYQWRKREGGSSTFTDVAGATASVLSLTGLTPAADNGDEYCVVVSSADGSGVSVTSGIAVLNVPSADINITEQPQDFLSLTGSAVFSTNATSSNLATVFYQWQVKKPGSSLFADIPSATSRTLSLSGLTASVNDQDAYRAAISASGAPTVFSRTATLNVPSPSLSITYQPTIQTSLYGAATFLVSATTSPFSALSYQWQKQTKGVGSFVDLPGRASATLSLNNLKYASDNGDVYRVVVTATSGLSGSTFSTSLTSAPAPLSVPDESGQVWAWGGNNAQGQLGSGTYNIVPPPPPSGLISFSSIRFSSIAAGRYHSLAITTTGRLMAWGLNGYGQLGLGSRDNKNSPFFVGSASNWTSVSAGDYHSAGIAGGALYSWGVDLQGAPDTPRRIGSASNWVAVACGGFTIFAINSAGELWGLGEYNNFGQVGDGTTNPTETLVRIGSATNWSKVFAGGDNSFAITTTGQLWGWGYNASGAVGDGTISPRTSPVRIGTSSDWVGGSSRNAISYAITSGGGLWGWGGGSYGIGDGTTDPRVIPTQIGLGKTWSSVSVSGECAFATTAEGELWGWGSNRSAQIGGNSVSVVLSPTRIGPQINWASVSAGTDFVAALTAW